MVLSKIHPSIVYSETKDLYEEDIDSETELYEINIEEYNLNITIAVGKPRYTHSKQNIVFIPIYLVHNDEFIMQIGIFEIPSQDFSFIIDNNNEIDVAKINREILLFSFINKETLLPYINNQNSENSQQEDEEDEKDEEEQEEDEEEQEDEDEEEEEEEEYEDEKDETKINQSYKQIIGSKLYNNIFIDKPNFIDLKPLTEESIEDANKEKSEFKEKLTTSWIEKFMKNNNYNILNTNPDGDCFFQTIRDAFDSIGKKTTIKGLRQLVSDSINEEIYGSYLEKYEMFNESFDNDTKEINKLKEEIKLNKKKYKLTKDRKTQEVLEKQIKESTLLLKKLSDGLESTKELLEEFIFMKKIKNINDFKEYILTSKYWADSYAISIIENILNIKMIILSQESYEINDKDNVILCNESKDYENKIFEPYYYIITQYSGDHYDLITYKSRQIFKFEEVPYDIKKLILMKCLEKNSGVYNNIPEFKQMKSKYDDKLSKYSSKYINDDDNELYDNKIVFQIYNNSSDKPFPGKGAGELIEPDEPETIKMFTPLSKIINWRRKLSNTYESPFLLNGKNWNSVEHYIQAHKFKSNPELFEQFTLDSNSSISKDPLKARDAGTKRNYFKDKFIIDKDFLSNASKYTEQAQEAKFSDETFKEILLATKNAKIVNFTRANLPIIMNELMTVRKNLM